MKTVSIIVIVILLIAGGVFGWMWYKTKTELEREKIDRQAEVTKLNQTVSEKEKNIETLNANVLTEKANVVKLENQIKKLSADQLSAAQGKLDEKDKAIQAAKDEVKKVEDQVAALTKQIETAQAELDGKEKQVSNLRQVVENKDTQIGKLSQNITALQKAKKEMEDLAEKLKNRLLENKIPLEPEKQFNGHVLVVNKDQGFIVIDIGADDNLPVGKKLKVVRKDSYIGDIEVKKLLVDQDGHLSYAVVTELTDKTNPVQEGDLVSNIIGTE